MRWGVSIQNKEINGSFFYGSVPGCSEVESRASNLCRLRVSLPGACEATRNIRTVYGRKDVICSLVRHEGRRIRAALCVFDTWLSRSCPSLASRNQLPWLYRRRSSVLSHERIHQHHAGSKNLRREMKHSPMKVLPFLLIRFSSSFSNNLILRRNDYATLHSIDPRGN